MSSFSVTLDVFDGPFDLLLSLITKHELDITEVALSLVTDEFIAHLRQMEEEGKYDLDQASEFLVVAATLLDMKVASLIPQGEVVDTEAIQMLEARDLLFARLLQYRAFKQASGWFATQILTEEQRYARSVPLDIEYRAQTPQLQWHLSLADFHALALMAFTPKEVPVLGLEHLHAPLVSIREQAAIIVSMLKSGTSHTFRQLITGVTERGVIVARFLALLELYRAQAVAFEQEEPLGDLSVRWVSEFWSDDALSTLGADYD